MASDALRAFRGHRIVYVGEDSGGCTGDQDFHELLNSEWQDAADVEEDINEDALMIDQWPGLHDYVHLLVRRH
jgi:hypothetical protein